RAASTTAPTKLLNRKAPGRPSVRRGSFQLVTRSSRNDVAVDADAQSVVVLILDGIDRGRLGRAGKGGKRRGRAVRRRLQLLVDHIEADIEPRREVVLGPGTERPEGPVVAALPGGDLGGGDRDRPSSAGHGEEAEGATADGVRALRIADRQIGIVAVIDFKIRPVDRRPEVRKPQVVVGRVDAPDSRQLDFPGGIAENAVREEAVAEVLAVELVGAERTGRSKGDVADGPLGVGGLPLEVVALIEVETRAAADCPAHLVGRMTANLGAGDRAGGSAAEDGSKASRQA